MSFLSRVRRPDPNLSEVPRPPASQTAQAQPPATIPDVEAIKRALDRYRSWSTILMSVYRVSIIFFGMFILLLLAMFLVGDAANLTTLTALSLVGCIVWTLVYQQIADIVLQADSAAPITSTPLNVDDNLRATFITTTRGRVNRLRYYLWRYTVAVIASALGIFSLVLILHRYGVLPQALVVFPLVALFPFSYMAYIIFQRPIRVESLRRDFVMLGEPWDEDLYQQSQGFWNFGLHILMAMVAATIGALVFTHPIFHGTELAIAGSSVSGEILRAVGLGFLGAYLFSGQLIYRRFTTYDLLPYVYLYCALTIIAGIALNYALFKAIFATPPEEEVRGITAGLLDVLSFALGFFPLLATQWLTRLAYSALRQNERRSDQLPLDLIDGISSLHEVRLRDYGIDNLQNLAAVEIPRLLINTRFGAQQVIDWIDQALLYLHLDPGEIASFRNAKIRTVTDFTDTWERHEILKVEPVGDPAEPPALDESDNQAPTPANWKDQLGITDIRLEVLYCTVTRGPNYQSVKNYWRSVKNQAKQRYNLSQYNLLLMDVYNAPANWNAAQWINARRTAHDYRQRLDPNLAPKHGIARAALGKLAYTAFKQDPTSSDCLNEAIDQYREAIKANNDSNAAIIKLLKDMVEELSELAQREVAIALNAEHPLPDDERKVRLDRAHSFYKRAREISKEFYGDNTPNLGLVLNLAAFYIRTQENLDAAVAELDTAWETLAALKAKDTLKESFETHVEKVRPLVYELVSVEKVEASKTTDELKKRRHLDNARKALVNAVNATKQFNDEGLPDLHYLLTLAKFEQEASNLPAALARTEEGLEICAAHADPVLCPDFRDLKAKLTKALASGQERAS